MIPKTKLLQSFTRGDTIQDWTRCETGIAVQSSGQQLHSDVFASTACIHNVYRITYEGSAIPVCVCVVHEYTSLVRAVPPLLWEKRNTFCSTSLAIPTACWKKRNSCG